MYVHSLVVKKDLQLRHEAIVRVGKRQLIKKHSRNTGSARIAVCVLDNGQWTMDMMILISSSLDICTYLPYVYIRTVRSSQVGTVHISAGTRQQDRKSFLTPVYIPEFPVPMKSTKICEDHRLTVGGILLLLSFLFSFSIHFSPSPTSSTEPSPWLEQICPDINIYAYLAVVSERAYIIPYA